MENPEEIEQKALSPSTINIPSVDFVFHSVCLIAVSRSLEVPNKMFMRTETNGNLELLSTTL